MHPGQGNFYNINLWVNIRYTTQSFTPVGLNLNLEIVDHHLLISSTLCPVVESQILWEVYEHWGIWSKWDGDKEFWQKEKAVHKWIWTSMFALKLVCCGVCGDGGARVGSRIGYIRVESSWLSPDSMNNGPVKCRNESACTKKCCFFP